MARIWRPLQTGVLEGSDMQMHNTGIEPASASIARFAGPGARARRRRQVTGWLALACMSAGLVVGSVEPLGPVAAKWETIAVLKDLWALAAKWLADPDLVECTGFAAAACVILTFSCTSALLLRGFAVASNCLFITYAAQSGLMPVLWLHAILLPINLLQIVRLIVRSGER